MKYVSQTVLLCLLCSSLLAQTPPVEGIFMSFNFQECPQDKSLEEELNNVIGIFEGGIMPDCICGVVNNAIRFDGGNDYLEFSGAFDDKFDTRDFSLSFYVRPQPAVGEQEVFSKRNLCNPENSFSVTYQSNTNEIKATLRESQEEFAVIRGEIPVTACWTHVVIVRDGDGQYLYIDGELAQERASSRIDISNGGPFIVSGIAKSVCPGLVPFAGGLDEIRLYRKALTEQEIDQLNLRPERILSPNTITIIKGESVQVDANISCSNQFVWTPSAGVSDVTGLEPELTPEETTTYRLRMELPGVCAVTDTIQVIVIDPDDFDCGQVFLPEAFTPNGDGLNETFGLSNPFVFDGANAENFISLEVFDRWGGRVFFSQDPFARWDATFNTEPVNPGVFVYRLIYTCQGEEFVRVGNVSVIR